MMARLSMHLPVLKFLWKAVAALLLTLAVAEVVVLIFRYPEPILSVGAFLWERFGFLLFVFIALTMCLGFRAYQLSRLFRNGPVDVVMAESHIKWLDMLSGLMFLAGFLGSFIGLASAIGHKIDRTEIWGDIEYLAYTSIVGIVLGSCGIVLHRNAEDKVDRAYKVKKINSLDGVVDETR